jgi:hypothetical protein
VTDVPSAVPEGGSRRLLDRRRLFADAIGTAGAATVAGFWVKGFGDPRRRLRIQPTAPGAPTRTLSEAEWRALEAATDRLLPSEPGSPGARDVNAVGYLDAVMAEADVDDLVKTTIRRGLARLDETARARGSTDFAALPATARDEVIRGFEGDDAGIEWLQRTIAYTLEAFLGDPVHGGNPEEIGWKWANHVPGSPRPKAR